MATAMNLSRLMSTRRGADSFIRANDVNRHIKSEVLRKKLTMSTFPRWRADQRARPVKAFVVMPRDFGSRVPPQLTVQAVVPQAAVAWTSSRE
jgi:hypothetical protein